MAEEEPQDAAAEAFEALRAEVAQVRAALEGLGPVLGGTKGPDYSPTLGAMAKSLEKIEGHPALQYTPDRYGLDVRAATEATRRDFEGEVQLARNAILRASQDVERFAGSLRTREQQQTWLIRAGAGGVVAGAVLWAMFSGPLARALPASWHLPEKTAARTLGLDRWQAGQQLMASARPQDWRRLAWAGNLERDNREALQACRDRPKSRGPVRCMITVQAEGDGFGTAPR